MEVQVAWEPRAQAPRGSSASFFSFGKTGFLGFSRPFRRKWGHHQLPRFTFRCTKSDSQGRSLIGSAWILCSYLGQSEETRKSGGTSWPQTHGGVGEGRARGVPWWDAEQMIPSVPTKEVHSYVGIRVSTFTKVIHSCCNKFC